MFLLWGLLKAIFTDISGGYRQRIFKNPAEDIPIWQIGQDIRDYKDLLKMSQDEMSEEQRQALLSDDKEAREETTVLHSFPPSREEQAGLRQGQEEELVQRAYEEVIEDPDEEQNPETDASDDSDFPEMPSMPELSLDWAEDSEPEEAT